MGKFLDFEEIRKQFPILDVAVRLLNAQLKQEAPNKYRGPCPFCSDPRSFRITTDAGNHGQGMAGCFKCGPKGDAISLVAKKFGLKANDAAEYIQAQMGTVSKPEPVTTVPPGTSNVSDDKLQKIADRLDHECDEVQGLGLSPETAEALGVGLDHKGGTRGRILFPLFYKDGRLAGFLAYGPDQEPILKLPSDLLMPTNVVKFPKAG